MTAQTFTPAVDTTFLPKTNGLVFEPRLKVRSDKGRVFGVVDVTLEPEEIYVPLGRRTNPQLAPDNIYEAGRIVYAVSGTFSGGTTETLYRSRFQYKLDLDAAFVKAPWTVHSNVPMIIDFKIPEGVLEIRLQSQARDASQDPIDVENFFTTTISI